ncbi:MAG: hypothetical protein ACI9S8_000220 [Chlamydiales bacterium]|jgi:hypothetical protein
MQIICNKKYRTIPVENTLSSKRSLTLHMEPFSGTREFLLQLGCEKKNKIISYHIHNDQDAFPTPRYSESFSDIPPKTYFIICNEKQTYTVFFSLSHNNLSTYFHPDSEGIRLTVESYSDTEDKQTKATVICFRGSNLNELIGKTLSLALDLSGGTGKMLQDKPSNPSWFNTMGWESGLPFGKNVSQKNILDSIWSLKDLGFQPGYAIIDDGWQAKASQNLNDFSDMAGFDIDKSRFPLGLKGLVSKLNNAGVQHIGLSHKLMGSPEGIHPTVAEKYHLSQNHEGKYLLGKDLGNTFCFFHDYYEFLKKQGITFIKVCEQNEFSSHCINSLNATLIYKNLQTAIQAAASIHFNSPHINTDCLRNENLFYWTTSQIARSAENVDYNNPVGIKRIIRNHLTNSLWLQHFMNTDFDSWQTNTDYSESLSIFHALSGSIITIGDRPNAHNKTLLKKVFLPSGKVLKADVPLQLCEDSIFIDPIRENNIYKAFTRKGLSGVVALFNLTSGNKSLQGTVSPSDVGTLFGTNYAAHSHYHGFLGTVSHDEKIPIKLKPNLNDVITFSPIKNGIALLGCYSFLLIQGPILDLTIGEDTIYISTVITAPLLIYCERKVLEIRRNGKIIPWDHNEKNHILSIDTRSNIEDSPSNYTVGFES